jgi:flagellar basal body-associated protein FliL
MDSFDPNDPAFTAAPGAGDEPAREVAPHSAVSVVSRRIRPLAVGTGAVLAALVTSGGLLLSALGAEGAVVAGLAAQARELDAEKEWALAEFAPSEAPGTDVALGLFLVNPLGAAKVRYVRCAVTLTVADAEAYEGTGVAQARARAAIVGLLGTRTVEELGQPGGLDRAREQVRRVIRAQFDDELLLAIHFSEFVVQ